MKRFLAIYTGSMDGFERAGWNTLDPEARKAREAEGMKAWMDWATANAVQHRRPGQPARQNQAGVARGHRRLQERDDRLCHRRGGEP